MTRQGEIMADALSKGDLGEGHIHDLDASNGEYAEVSVEVDEEYSGGQMDGGYDHRGHKGRSLWGMMRYIDRLMGGELICA